MLTNFTGLSFWTSDAIWFPVLQFALVAFTSYAAFLDRRHARRAGRGGVTLQVTRSEVSMGYLYSTYAVINGLLVAVCLAADVASNHRVLFVFIDTILVVYICLFNQWFRNLLIGWTLKLPKIEKR